MTRGKPATPQSGMISMSSRLMLLLGLLVMCGCAGAPAPNPARHPLQAEDPAWSEPPLEQVIAVLDGRSGEPVTLARMLDSLAAADAVFLGETHVDETTHRVELAVYEGLLERRAGRVVLALEMFERDVQAALDAYLSGACDEITFRAEARPWGNYQTAYRPLIERARLAERPVVASNFPRRLARKVGMEGLSALDALEGAARRQAPAQILANTPAYWKRVDNAVRGHLQMMRRASGDQERLSSTQTLWDNSMGESCALALDAHPGFSVLHVNGGFHSAHWDGSVRQFQLRKPAARVLTVDIRTTGNPALGGLGGEPVADFVVYAQRRAADLNDGAWSVDLARSLKYRLHVPEHASESRRVPLLIWLGEDGLTAEDGLELWRSRFEGEAAIAVLEPPYRALQADLSEGGRWFWPDSFAADVGSVVSATEDVWAYLLRHFPLDPGRVCVAGEGTGATVAAAIALLGDRASFEAVALSPRRYSKIKDYPLPLPEARGDVPAPDVRLKVLGGREDEAWWREELAAYGGIGLDGRWSLASPDPWLRDFQQENALRTALGLAEISPPEDGPRALLRVRTDSARARHWSRLFALRHGAATGQRVAVVGKDFEDDAASEISIPMHPAALTDALPKCPGPFGGTTVLVLPEGLPVADERAWLALEENDPLNKQSRFHRLRVATLGGERDLPAVLRSLEQEGRKNVLIVPAVFCAEGDLMRGLERRTRALSDRMTLRWLPGLGGEELPVSAAGSGAAIGTVEHVLTVELDPERQHILVEDTIALPPALRRAGVEFTLSSALTIRSSEPALESVGEEADGMTRYALQASGADGLLRLSYDGVFDFGLSDQKEEYTRGFRETRGTLGPEGVYLDGESGWTARFSTELVRFTLDVTAPDDWRVISQGNGTSRDGEGVAHWDSAADLEQVYLVGGPLVLESDTAGAVDVEVYLHERDDALSQKYLDATVRYLEMYRQLIGPYPYGKFALVENFWETGYGMPSFTLLGPEVMRFPFILHSSYPHEILHNWWGNSVFVDYESGNWCEGLTAYMADHLIQEQRGLGADYRRRSLQKYRDHVKAGRDFPLAEFKSRHSAATEAVGYGKALMLFHMLRRRIGDDAFRASLVGFYRKARGTRAAWDDIRAACESVVEEDLVPFFEQWVRRSGAPRLVLENTSVSKAVAGYVVSGVLRQTQAAEPFALEVPIQVLTSSGPEQRVIEIDARSRSFEMVVDGKPLLFAVDPAFDVFRQLDARETPSSIGQIFGEPRILAVLPSEENARRAYLDLLLAWETDAHGIERVLDADLERLPTDRSIWILGRDNRFAAGLAGPETAAAASTIALGGREVPIDQRSIVVIRRHPENAEKAIGWISIEPAAAFAGMARKLPHYGRYSYLAFEGEEPSNTVKGRWEATGSPLVVDLRGDDTEPATLFVSEPRAALAELPAVFSRRELLEHVRWLAAPERAGRGLGTPELEACAAYIAEALAAAGLQPGGDEGSWFQRFTVEDGPTGAPLEALNVIGVLPGARSDWSAQSVVLSAHYDHLGLGWPDVHAGDEGRVHPGADDNASGVAVLIELARNLVRDGGGSRNLVFAAFSAEESGLLGSRHYVAHPRFPAESILGVINMDTVGRLGKHPLAIHATGTAEEWQHVFRGVGFVTGIPSRNVPARIGGSDQDSFIDQGIPAVQIFSGAHGDYHRPSDTPDKIDATGLVKVATFVKEALVYLLEREDPLTITIDGRAPAPSATGGRGGRKVSFGTVPAFEYQGHGVQVDSVVPGSPAQRAGLRAGDVLVQLDDTSIADLRAFSQFLRTLEAGQEIAAVVTRAGERVTMAVQVEAR